jgi:orotidine-5'-phosphate decarboxylase
MSKIIGTDRSIIPACDVTFDLYQRIVKETADVEKVGGYKVGVSFLDVGLKSVVDTARRFTDKPFMDSMVRAGINAIILFPQAGPITEYEWIMAAQESELGVIVGGEMTHPRYMQGDYSNGKGKNYSQIFREMGIEREITGFIREFAPEDMYEIAARMGVTNFVVPGNKPDRILHYKELIKECGVLEPVFFSPGLVAQGGKIEEGAKAAGERFHAIVGRGIYEAPDFGQAAIELTSNL